MSTTIINKEGITYGCTVEMESIICYACAIPFAVPAPYRQHLKDTRETFYCPNGHSQCYSKSTETILREKIERIEREKAAEIERLNVRIVYKDVAIADKIKEITVLKSKHTKLKNRIVNGVCPCCNRSFQNLHSHIKTKHPDYKSEEIMNHE